MKIKWKGMDIDLTVEEFQELITRGIIDDPEDEKVPYPDTWKDLLKRIPIQPNQPVQPSDPLKPYVNPQPSPFPFPTVTAYGCQSVQGPLGGVAQWDGTTALGGKLNIKDIGEVMRVDGDNTGNKK